MKNLTIDHLKNHPEHLNEVATIIYNEWWTNKPGVTIDSMAGRLSEAKTDNEIPLSLGVKELYLGTDIPQYYESFGAKIHATGSKELKIMKIDLR